MKTITITETPSFVGQPIDINNIPADVAEANANIGKPSSRAYVGDVIDFDPSSLKAFERKDRDGKGAKTRSGKPIIGTTMNAEITANGQTRVVVVDLQNYLRTCNGVMIGHLTQTGVSGSKNLIDNSKAFAAWIQQNPTKKFVVAAPQGTENIEVINRAGKPAVNFEIPILEIV